MKKKIVCILAAAALLLSASAPAKAIDLAPRFLVRRCVVEYRWTQDGVASVQARDESGANWVIDHRADRLGSVLHIMTDDDFVLWARCVRPNL